MRQLCKICFYFAVEDWADDEMLRIQSIHDLLYENTAYLIVSTDGTSDGRACHLWTLSIRNLKDYGYISRRLEGCNLPIIMVFLDMQKVNGSYQLIAGSGDIQGALIQLSIGSG